MSTMTTVITDGMILIMAEAITPTIVIEPIHIKIVGIVSPIITSGLSPIRALMTALVPAGNRVKTLKIMPLSLLTASNTSIT